MTQDPSGEDRQPASSGLPDFADQDPSALPDYQSSQGPATLGEPSERARKRTLAVVLSVVGSGVVLLAIVALVLSQTVFRSVLEEDDAPTADGPETRSAEAQSEYVPDPEDPDIAPPPPIFTQEPTTECSIPDSGAQAPSPDPGTVRGGDLEYTVPDGWDFPWGSQPLPYMSEVGAKAREVEQPWYSVVNVGRVTWPEEDDGGYPGLEGAAVAIFQCYATTSGVVEYFGENPDITDYRSETMTVDGQPAWIVQATYHFEDPDVLESSSASVVTSIVVEGPNGPSALASDVAADQPEHVEDLENIIASLDVVE
ncbi:hypothetical protein ACFQRD_02435 [Brachybacterium sp. GCM10030268]|uniref:hypothetical protein n=1 Tax=Brachybacterium sp. GCM10030268 TaxID=3273382 RepID=UPI003621269B